jgi:modulator of FtsH protease
MDRKFEPVMTGSQSSRSTPFGGQFGPMTGQTEVAVDRNRVLRNTYWLLALSLLPTIAGAFVGSQLNLFGLFRAYPIAAPLGMFAVMLGSLFVVTRLRNSAWGVAALFGFTFIAGLMLTPILTVAAGLKNGGQLVGLAAGLSFMGKFLFIGLIVLLVASLANIFLAIPALSLTISAVAVLLFSAYLLHDISSIVNGGETNYVMATMNVYLSLYNIFLSLLNLLMAFSGQRD